MRVFSAITGLAAAGLIWTAAGAASAQELQPGQLITPAEADRLAALQADLDREEAEDIDADRRDRQRAADELDDLAEALDDMEYRRRAADERRDAELERSYDARRREEAQREIDRAAAQEILNERIRRENAEARAEWERTEATRFAVCVLSMDESKKSVVAHIRATYTQQINVMRQNPTSGTAEAIAGLERARDASISRIEQEACDNPDEVRRREERQVEIDSIMQRQHQAMQRR